MKSALFFLGLLLATLFPFSNFTYISIAAEVRIFWDPNSESDLGGYEVYQGTGSSGPPYVWIDDLYLDEIDDLDNPGVTLTQLQEDVNNYFVVTAFDKAGNISQFSNEICIKIEDSSIINCTSASNSGGGDGGSSPG